MPTLRSPRYNVSIASGSLAAGGMEYVDFTQIPICKENIPYNNIIVRNFSSNRLKVEYGDTVIMVGSYEIFIDDKAYGMQNLKITNVSTAAQDDLIYITVSRDITADQAIVASITGENLHKIANGEA